jgi:hypothetical protein
LKKNVFAILFTSAMVAGTSFAFKIDFIGITNTPIHEEITREALSSIIVFFEDGTPAKLRSDFIGAVAEENTENDEAGLDYGQMHFDDSRLRESAAYVWNAKLGAVEAFKNGNPAALDGKGVQVNLGTAMHTIQDFFAHSTWVEMNYSRNGNAPYLPTPRLGLVENPFIERAFIPVEILDVEASRSADGQPTTDKVCGFSLLKQPTEKLTSAYYDLAMSDMPNLVQFTKEFGFYTDQWSSQNRTTLGFLLLKETRFETSSPLGWPLGRCVHGGDAADQKGINKDQGLRVGHLHARKAAIQATRAFMLDFLASANVLATSNKQNACQYMFDCEESKLLSEAGSVIAPVTPANSAALGGSIPATTLPIMPSNFVVTVGYQEAFGGESGNAIKVYSSNWPAQMLSYSFDETPCIVYRPFKLDDVSDLPNDKVICPTAKVGAGTFRVFQTALPKMANVLHTETITINTMPPTLVDVQPKIATINQPTLFTVTGTHFPATAELSISGGGSCVTPTTPNADPSTGFKQTCTPSGSAGTRSVSVLLQAGGAAIGAAQTISVSAAPPITPVGNGINVLLGSPVTDSCFSCPFNVYGDPALLTNGDTGTAARNLGTYSGSFNIFTATAVSLSRVVVFPVMSPSGSVTYEVQTSSSATGAAGTWTSHGIKTSAWLSGIPFNIDLGATVSGVRVVKIVIQSSPSWVSFSEFEGYLGAPVATGIFNAANGHRYEVITCGTWTQCDAAGRAKGGNLVTIRNANEQTWINSNVLPLVTAPNGVWIGLTDRVTEGTWAWTSGEAAPFFNWRVGEPNSLNGGVESDYVQMYSSGSLIGQWNDAPETLDVTNQAIVEYSLSGTFSVAANNSAGTLFAVPAGATSCTFNATGSWTYGAASSSSADGIASFNSGQYLRLLPSTPYFSLIAKSAGTYSPIGSSKTLTLSAGESLAFQINEGIGIGDSYADNSGALTVAYQCQ